MFQIIDQTSDFVVVVKPAGISVHKDQEEAGFTMMLQQQLDLEQIFLVHRLDKITSGLMVFAKSTEAAKTLADQFKNREVSKYYLAISANKPKRKQGLIMGDMEKARRGGWKLVKSRQNPAVTQFFSCSLKPGFRLFLLKPTTGKTHQIRVALKSEGAPILGDNTYGGELSDRTYLHAYSLAFSYGGERYTYKSYPEQGDQFDQEALDIIKEHFDRPESLSWPKLPEKR